MQTAFGDINACLGEGREEENLKRLNRTPDFEEAKTRLNKFKSLRNNGKSYELLAHKCGFRICRFEGIS